MFASAIEKVKQFTKPVIVSTRRFDGTVDCGIGAFVILNENGWIATAMHMFAVHVEQSKHGPELADYRAKVKAIEEDKALLPKQKAKRIARLATNPKWITNFSYWWAADGRSVDVWHGIAGSDIAIGQIAPFAPGDCSLYPTLKKATSMKVGTSLCRFGYPFHNVTATFDDATRAFSIPPRAC